MKSGFFPWEVGVLMVAAEEGITTMGAEFIGNAVLAGGQTIAETYSDRLAVMARSGALPTLSLPGAEQ